MDVKFQPTRPLRGATVAKHTNNLDEKISTHAPLAGRDFAVSTFVLTLLYFNPRAPCGARLVNDFDVDSDTLFQPTRPLRGATSLSTSMTKLSTFQPTRPLRGATNRTYAPFEYVRYFNPRAPCGARPITANTRERNIRFQPTRPLRGATFDRNGYLLGIEISTHAPLAGRDVLFGCHFCFC